jgi:hypothetical protein
MLLVGEQFRVAVRSFSGSQGRSAPAGVASRRLQGPSKARRGAEEAGEAGAEHGQAGRGRCQEHEHVAASGGRERARAVSFLEASLPRLATTPSVQPPCLECLSACDAADADPEIALSLLWPLVSCANHFRSLCLPPPEFRNVVPCRYHGWAPQLLSCGHGASSLRERTVWFASGHGHIGVSHLLKRTELNISFTISAYLSSTMSLGVLFEVNWILYVQVTSFITFPKKIIG